MHASPHMRSSILVWSEQSIYERGNIYIYQKLLDTRVIVMLCEHCCMPLLPLPLNSKTSLTFHFSGDAIVSLPNRSHHYFHSYCKENLFAWHAFIVYRPGTYSSRIASVTYLYTNCQASLGIRWLATVVAPCRYKRRLMATKMRVTFRSILSAKTLDREHVELTVLSLVGNLGKES
jgi:hypothetical protein